MTVADELGALKPYFADGVAETEQEKMDELHAIFHRDFFENTVIIAVSYTHLTLPTIA